LTASASMSGGAALGGLRATPRFAASEAIPGDGLGSRMASEDGGRPASSQPWAIAPPIFPAPMRTRRAGHSFMSRSGNKVNAGRGNPCRDCGIFASLVSIRQMASQQDVGLNRLGSLKRFMAKLGWGHPGDARGFVKSFSVYAR